MRTLNEASHRRWPSSIARWLPVTLAMCLLFGCAPAVFAAATPSVEELLTFLHIDRTEALSPLILPYDSKELPETYPAGQ